MTCTFDGVALVTGGAQGIGEAIGRGLAAQGATVALVDIDLDLAESVAADIRHAGGEMPRRTSLISPIVTRSIRWWKQSYSGTGTFTL